MDKITRRAVLLAKMCWPEIDTRRTKFLPVSGKAVVVHPPNDPNALPDQSTEAETISIDKWVYHGKHKHAVARWGYSRKLDIVVIRDVMTTFNWAIDCDRCDTPQEAQP